MRAIRSRRALSEIHGNREGKERESGCSAGSLASRRPFGYILLALLDLLDLLLSKGLSLGDILAGSKTQYVHVPIHRLALRAPQYQVVGTHSDLFVPGSLPCSTM